MRVEQYIAAEIRNQIEERYYAKVNTQARLEQLICDPAFMERPEDHVGVFSDHGVVHVRDVARQILDVLDKIHGILIPARCASRQALMHGYGVLVAYFHDIGMFDFSSFGRTMHPEFASHSVFHPDLDEIMAEIWGDNSGNLSWRLAQLAHQGILPQDPYLTLREMMAMAVCHSKSKVPVDVLNDPRRLREFMLDVVGLDLQNLYARQRTTSARLPAAEDRGDANRASDNQRLSLLRHYERFEDEAFQWLVSPHPAMQELVQDVVDTLRALRCADALRQRGTVLRTSGGYEIFMDQRSAHAIFAFNLGDDRQYLLEMSDPISVGEANMASSELDPACDLRFSFHRGAFTGSGATEFAVACAARVVYDIQNDVIGSFQRPPGEAPLPNLKRANEMQILLEETDDNLDFVEMVRARIMVFDTSMEAKIQIAPSLQQASERERDRYLRAHLLDWDREQRQALLARVGESGHCTERIDLEGAFANVKPITLAPGEILLEAGAPAAFVYIPLGPGLRILPLGGYASLSAPAWLPLGVTGVIRGAARNATIKAEQRVRLLMIPKTVYLKQWHRPHTSQSFLAAVTKAVAKRSD